MRAFHWTAVAEQAALDLAEGELTHRQVAESAGVHFTTLYRWLRNSEFAARVAENEALLREAAAACAIAQRHHRIRRLNEHWYGLQRIIETRATAPEMQGEPGGSTGLLRRQVRRYGSGAKAVVVVNFVLDTATLRELRLLEKQAAIEMGQWPGRIEHSPEVAPPPTLKVLKSTPTADQPAEEVPAPSAESPQNDSLAALQPRSSAAPRVPSRWVHSPVRQPAYTRCKHARCRCHPMTTRRYRRPGTSRS